MDILSDLGMLTDFLGTTIRLAVPITFAAVGGLISERSGVFNIALEGSILGGAFGAALGAFLSGSPHGGLMLGICVGAFAGILLAVLGVSLGINQIVAGIAINVLFLGLTSFLSRALLGQGATSQALPGYKPIAIWGLSKIPLLGTVLFNQDPLTYLMYATVALSWWVLFRTPWGMNVRAAGQFPAAVDTAGISVAKVRYAAVIISCTMASLGGCCLVLSQVYIFTEHMSAGRGFIALSALILGRWNPLGALLACLLFGFFDALQLLLQFSHPDMPYQIFSMFPYLASLIALVFFATKVRPPEAIGIKFVRGGK